MEQRNYLKRARAFLRSATKLSLKVAPLALAAANVMHAASISQADYVFQSGSTSNKFCQSGGCTVTGGSPSGNNTLLPGTVSLFVNSGGSMFYSTTGGAGTLGIFWQGAVNPNLPAGSSDPFSWNFTLSGNGSPVNWALTLSGALSGFASGGTSQLTGFNVLSTSSFPFIGSSIATTNSNTSNLTVELDVSTTATDSVTINIPAGATIDLTLGAVPEPASALLIAPALGGLWFIRRRRKKA